MKVIHADREESEEEMQEADDASDRNDEVSSDDDEPEVNVWNVILDEARDADISVLESFR